MKERKYIFGQVRKIAEDVDETRTVTFAASNNSRDGHGTILPVDKWDLSRFEGNPVIGYQHNLRWSSDPDEVIGRGKAYIEGDELLVDITFEPEDVNPKAEKVYKKVRYGTLRAVSVGFNPTKEGRMGDASKGEDPQTYYFDGQELIEVSVVNIPSNKHALKKSLAAYEEALRALEDDLPEDPMADTGAPAIDAASADDSAPGTTEEQVDETHQEDSRKADLLKEKIIIAEAERSLLLINN